MLSRTVTCATYGIEAHLVEVETSIESGQYAFNIVGLPDNAVRESKVRVVAAIKNSGFVFPFRNITVNLAPADIKKEGSSYDLPIAVGALAASGQLDSDILDSFAALGELMLDGSVRHVHGVLPVAVEAKRKGLAGIVLPKENAKEAAMVEGLKVYPVSTLGEAVGVLGGEYRSREPHSIDLNAVFRVEGEYVLDFRDVKGQENVKRAIEVAAAGGHNIIMIGPPGSGKTMVAKRIPSILPPLSFDEGIETTKIHSVSGYLPPDTAVIATRPYRSPHHSISDAALVGGGAYPRPGEVSLAHNGVLFLDELPEFRRSVLEVLRQPLEDGRVTISRSKLSIEYPANFMLASAMNPCPCGYFTDPSNECTCTPLDIQRYMSKISGPLLDRIDIHIEVPAVKYRELASGELGENSASIRDRVVTARARQTERFRKHTGIFCNAGMGSKEIREYCRLDEAGAELLKMAITKLGLSARAYDRIQKVARTIADLAGSESIRPEHVSEAIQYRSLDRNLWV
jgi:magnesium chelatase family protein